MKRRLVSSCLVPFLLACGNDAKQGVATGDASTLDALRNEYRTAGDAVTLRFNWQDCPVMTKAGAGTGAQCATVTVPRSWRTPRAGDTHVFVKRVPSLDQTTQQVWLVPGGPGGSAATLDLMASVAQGTLRTTEFLLMDARGAGRSDLLACPARAASSYEAGLTMPDIPPPPAEHAAAVARCFDDVLQVWPNGELFDFNTTETAMDLGEVARALQHPGERVLVYAVSFGTYTATRYLHLFPEQPAAVVMDSFVLPRNLAHRDQDIDQVARKILQVCATDATCRTRLGDDPVAFADSVIDELKQGHCPLLGGAGIDLARLQDMAQRATTDSASRPFLPALYFRAHRCTPNDVAALTTFASPTPSSPPAAPRSEPLARLVSRSELLAHDEVFSTSTESLIADYGSATEWKAVWDAVPAYPLDSFVGAWPSVDVPMLVLQGELDARTPVGHGEAAAAHFPNARLVSFPWKDHGVALDLGCGAPTVMTYLADPTAPLDTSCTSLPAPPVFTATSDDTTRAFGVPDMWD
jgi:pimeloyl-ACP methyl ester carboxylesterase